MPGTFLVYSNLFPDHSLTYRSSIDISRLTTPGTMNVATLTLLLLVLCATGATAAEKVKPATVLLKKCCPLGQWLDASQSCVVGGTDKWVPNILLISRGKLYTPMGEAPRFFRILDGVQPADCSVPLELYTGPIVVSSNGSLFVQEISASFGPAQFCVDKDAALVCQPPPAGSEAAATATAQTPPADIPSNMLHTGGIVKASAPMRRPKLRKCCGPDYVYDRSQANCKPLDEDSPHRRRTVTNSTAVDVIYGFPRCVRSGALYTMVEGFRDENLDVLTASVRLAGVGGRSFAPAEFCVEHTVNDTVYADVHVFTCAEHFGQQEPEWATGGDKEVSYLDWVELSFALRKL